LFSKWPILVKLLVGLGLLLIVVLGLTAAGLYATYSYRSLVKDLSSRAIELPLAAALSQHVGDLRNTLGELRGIRSATFPTTGASRIPLQARLAADQFTSQLGDVERILAAYRKQLEHKLQAGSKIADNQREWETVHKFEDGLAAIHTAQRDPQWIYDEIKMERLDAEFERLQLLAAELPGHLHKKLSGFADEVRNQYRLLIVGTWVSSIMAALIFGLSVQLFYYWIFVPLQILINGSRRIAAGDFDYRIHFWGRDELAELGDALNSMTDRFQAIRDDLDRQVQERTKQVVRSEQLASVGFLAAGVAHEINNPLASIALCAESLEGRTRELLQPQNPDHAVIVNYLQMIQNEAFRCKEITEKLLDFSRVGEPRRQATDLNDVVRAVIDIVGHLGKYHRKKIEFVPRVAVMVIVHTQEIKQVVLNLLTNALDSIDEDGTVWIELSARDGIAELVVADNGCGMDAEVLDHVFEPFFTRKRAGQGTGLGLSISYRIVSDHGGDMTAHSAGPGQGAAFRVHLPLAEPNKESSHHYQAA